MKLYQHNGLRGCVKQFKSPYTGTLVGIYHGAQGGIDIDPEYPWVSVCEEHNTCVSHRTLAMARLERDPCEFCEVCRKKYPTV